MVINICSVIRIHLLMKKANQSLVVHPMIGTNRLLMTKKTSRK